MTHNATPRPLLTVNALAAYLSVERSTLYRMLREDDEFIQPIRVGKRLRFRPEDVDAYLAR
jgi:excisionase family DNA binding protein